MDHFEGRQDQLQYSDEFLFTPRNSLILEKGRKGEEEEGAFTEKVKRISDQKYSTVTPNQTTIKRIQRSKDNNFMRNIKNDLVSLKTQVNKLISTNNEQRIYEESPQLRGGKRTNSESHSEISLDSHETQSLWKRTMKNQTQEGEMGLPSGATERMLRFIEEENEMLRAKIKKMKSKHREYKVEAEAGIRLLHQKLEEAEEVIADHQQDMIVYKREVEEEMMGIKRMLHANKEVFRRKGSEGGQESMEIKKLLEINSILNQNLCGVQGQLAEEKEKSRASSLENERLRQQIQHLTSNMETLINNPNTSLLRSGESKIYLDYSQSGIEREKGDREDERTLFFNLEDCLERKESLDFRNSLNISESKQEDLKRQYQTLLSQNDELVKQVRNLVKESEEKQETICRLNKQNQILNNKISLLQNQTDQLRSKCTQQILNSATHEKDQYIRELEDKIDKLEFAQLSKSSKIETTADLETSEGSLREKDAEISCLREELNERSEEVEKLRDSLGTLHREFRDSRGEVEIVTSKFTREIKHLREELETTRSTLKAEILLLQQLNEEMGQNNRASDKRSTKQSPSLNQYQFQFQANNKFPRK